MNDKGTVDAADRLRQLRNKYGAGGGVSSEDQSRLAALRSKYGGGDAAPEVKKAETPAAQITPVSQGMEVASFGKQLMGQTPSAVMGGKVDTGVMSAGEKKMAEQLLGKRKAAAEQRMKELDEIEADLKDFEIAVRDIPAQQRPVKDIGGFTSSEAVREEYNRVMAEYAAMLKENGQTDSNFGRNVRYVLERGGAGTMAALEGLADAGAAALADERVGKALRNAAPALGMAQQMNKLFDQLGVLPEGAGFDELADKMLSASPSQERMQSIESRYAPGKVGQTVGEVSQAVGGMVPTIAANILLPGSGLAVTGVQAGGQSAQQAYQERASLEQAVNFGVLTGALEAGTEAMFGGIAGLGKGFLDTAAGKGIGKMVSKLGASKTGKVLAALANNVFVKGLADSLGEGIEEGVSAILTPYLARLTYNKSAETATVNEVLHDVFIGALTGGVFQGVNAVAQAALGNKKTASEMETGEYRAVKPQNVELPTVPIINLSVQDVADLNGGTMPQKGNYVRKAAYEDTVKRLGLDQNEAAYIEASNVTRNGDAYVLKLTKPAIKKMLSAESYATGVVPLESVAVIKQIERIAQNGVWYESEGDRQGRPQVAGYDYLKTTVYIDNNPYTVNMRVRVEDQRAGGGNRLYHFTPETIEVTKKDDGAPSTTGRHATSIKLEDNPSSDATVPQAKPEVKEMTEGLTRMNSENMHVKKETARSAQTAQFPAQVSGERVQAGMDIPEQKTPQKAAEGAKPRAAGVYDTRTKPDAEPLNRVLSDRNVLYLKAVSRATGLRINIVDASENADGWYENGEIFIAENCVDPVKWIATHEVTHHLEQAAPEAYARYLEKVKNYLSEKGVLQKDIDEVRSVYAERGTALTEDGALREVAADFTNRLALDENLFNRIAREDRSLAQRLLDSLKEFIRRIRTTWSGQEIRQLEATRKAWEKALRESRGKTVETAERQYKLKDTPYIKNQLQKIRKLEVDFNSDSVSVGTVPDVYLNLFEIEELDMTLNVRHAYDQMVTKEQAIKDGVSVTDKKHDFHGMGVYGLTKAIESVAKPIVIMDADKSGDRKNLRIAMLLKPEGSLDVLFGVIELYSRKSVGGADHQRTHALLTIYDKKTAPDYVKSAVENERVLYIDKEQSLRGNPVVQFHGDIKESALRKNLAHFNQKVKQFKESNRIDDDKEVARRVDDGRGEPLKEQQLRVIKESNPAPDSYHTWIRNVRDIKTFEEVMNDPDWDYGDFDPSYSRAMAEEALESGSITVYSSYPIKNGVFVTPSRMEAESYSGSGQVFSKKVDLIDVAWIDPTQGQYAPTTKSGRQNAIRGLSDVIAEAEQGDKLAQGNALRRERARLSDVEHQKKLLEDGGMSALKENEKKIKALERRLQKLEGTMQPKTLDRKGQASTGARYLPTTAKRDLRRNLLDMFFVQDGVRAVAGKYIDWVADRMLNSGSLLDKDRTDLFNYLYNTGMVKDTATDAELDTMEREVEWALRTFAEKAKLEISLRKRVGTALAEERAARRKSLERQREFKNLQELQQKTLKQLQWLSKNRQKAPQDLKAAFNEVLGNIDTFAVGAANDMNWSRKHQATWRDLAQMYKTAKENDPNFLPSKELDRIVTRLDGDKIADMDVDALMELYRAAVGIRTEFYNRNNVINDEMNRMLAEIYTDSVREISSAAGRFTGKWADKLVNLQQLTPMNVLERMAGWNRDGAFYSMARQLEQGERDMRDYAVKANAMLEEFLTEHADWVKRADGQGKDAIWYEIEVPELLELGMGDKPIFGETRKVYMTPSQKVHMYLESKNYANLLHMVGGRTFANRELYSKGKRGEAFAQGTTIRLAPETVKKLVSDLTEEEMELARLLERYYDEFASERINRTSNALHGFDKAVTRNYAPIFTNKNYVQGEIGVFDMTAEGVGVMKGRQQYSKNPSYQIGCFDAFERHVDQTARYVGMAIPARNWNTLLNWREKNNSTWDVITHKWGKESKEYIEDLLKRLQGGKGEKGDVVSAGAGKLMSNYISSIFEANPSIVLKQIGSFFMAMPELGIENIPKPTQLKVDKELVGKYTSELAWRGMGYATPETKQLKENPTKLQTNKAVRFLTGGAITAMDQATASALWPWAENKVRKEFPELEVGTQEQIDAGESPFYKKVAAEFNDAVNRSQSVSDEVHQSSLKKSKNPITKTLTMFKSDSAQGYNQLRQRIGEARYYEKTGADEETVRKAKLAAGEAALGILANNAWAAVVSFLVALWKNKGKKYRDDEEELTARNVMLEITGDIFGGMAGLVVGGEELAEALGSIVTGGRWYGFDAPGIAQAEELVELVINSGQGAVEFARGAANVLKNDGNFGKYLKDHSNEIVGGLKELAQAAAQYFGGLPVGNLEAYLLGGVKWALPGAATAYEDALQRVEKNTLSGLSGKALEQRMGTLMKRRIGEIEKDTVKAMSALYESGHKGAVPTSAPDSVTVKGVEKTLNEAEKQFFDKAWSAAVAGVVDEISSSEEFLTADKKTQEDMLEKLYSYAREKAKAAILEEYELAKWVQEADGDVKAGESLSKWIVWEVLSSDVSSDFDKLTGAGLSNQKALEIAEELDELEPEAGKEDVSAMQRYGAIFSLPLSASDLDKAVKAVMSDSAYGKYKTARDAGISADDYWWFLKRTSTMSGSERKKQVLEFIDRMKLSDKQKDALFLAAGYKESGLSEAPWN